MPQVSLADWNQFLEKHPNAHLLQMGEWGELKNNFGWSPVRLVSTSSTHRMLNNEVGADPLPPPAFGLDSRLHAEARGWRSQWSEVGSGQLSVIMISFGRKWIRSAKRIAPSS